MKVLGAERVTKAMQKAMAKYESATVAVGYSANYALFVHENIEMKWRGLPRDRSVRKLKGKVDVVTYGHRASDKAGLFWGPTGRAKFLTGPLHEMRDELARVVAEGLKSGMTIAQAVLAAGLRLQRESQRNVPVDTGNLRASAFTELVK